ncbi:hypothetical protein [Brasilonema bromeliae]|uniref:Uncharacterized protein n=1 Tax=Brasilonema bromeliae SPC951 TaxID=385972 RepID=A0ABX1PBH8_9CYAN|nr:hypothetical protein [Brasilonema bromeliae]NMG21127.1 hypothetical protein [Brasilonema bromeliae SPC951]
MELQETQTKKTENNVLSAENIHDYINPEKIRESEAKTQAQTDNAVTSKEALDPRLRYGFTLILAIFLFIAAIYYGIINP